MLRLCGKNTSNYLNPVISSLVIKQTKHHLIQITCTLKLVLMVVGI